MADEGLLAAAGTVAAGAAILFATDAFKPVDKGTIKEEGNPDKLTDKSAKMRAEAMADYAHKYFEAARANARSNLIIALIQQAAAFYLADKQHDVAKQAQNRFDEIWQNQKDKSDKFFSHWYDNSRPIEIDMLNEARSREQQGYSVDYATAINRATAKSRSEFSRARDKVRRESNIHCVGASRAALRQLHIAEAKAVVLATNSAIRFEEERKHQRESQYREEMYKWNAMFQGRIGDSLNALQTAQKAAALAGSVDPYAGWAGSVQGLSNIGAAMGAMNMNAFQAGNVNTPSLFASGFF